MAKKKVEFEIKVVGNAQEELRQITGRTNALGRAAGLAKSKMLSLGQGFIGLNQAMELLQKVTRQLHEFSEAYQAQAEAEGKLERVMRNTMRARVEEIQSIKNLASAQQRLGVIGDEVQLAGAQELGTYLSKAESLKRLMPVMNDMLAQRRGKKRKNPYEKGFPAKRLLLTGWFPSFWRLVINEVRGLFWRVVDVELPDELETVLEVGAFGLVEGVEEMEGGDESVLLGLDGHVLLGCGDDLPESGEEVLELVVGDKKLDFWRRNGVFGVVARVVEEVRDAVECACDGVVIIWERDFYGGG